MGLFTTLRVREGSALFWADHLARLCEGAAALGLPPPERPETRVREAVGPLIDARVRFALHAHGAEVVAEAYAPPRSPWRLHPVSTSVQGGGPLLKTTDRERYRTARGLAGESDDALLHLGNGTVLECSTANVFVVTRHGVLVTPAAELPLLPGIARARVLAAARGDGIETEERALTVTEVAAARECFATNALFVVHPVAQIGDSVRFRDFPMARHLKELLRRLAPETRIIP